MSKNVRDNAVMVHGDVGETMLAKEEQKEAAEKKQQKEGEGKELQINQELKERRGRRGSYGS